MRYDFICTYRDILREDAKSDVDVRHLSLADVASMAMAWERCSLRSGLSCPDRVARDRHPYRSVAAIAFAEPLQAGRPRLAQLRGWRSTGRANHWAGKASAECARIPCQPRDPSWRSLRGLPDLALCPCPRSSQNSKHQVTIIKSASSGQPPPAPGCSLHPLGTASIPPSGGIACLGACRQQTKG